MVAPRLSLSAADPIVQALKEYSPDIKNSETHLAGVLNQAVGNPGKLIRARLVDAAATTHGMDRDGALQLACAVEYFHLASLLLDDLPCMDDAQTRRGRTCPHRVHGEAPTILSSLALINRAYALAGFALAGEATQIRLAAMGCLDACLGVPGLVGGQDRDLAFAESDRSAREVGRIAAAKTGALFWLAIYFPALLAEPDAEEGHHLKALCLYWGLAFQAMDDLGDLAITKSGENQGKTAGRDYSMTRPNLALAMGEVATKRRVARLMVQATRVLTKLTERRSSWFYLMNFHREYFEANVRLVLPEMEASSMAI